MTELRSGELAAAAGVNRQTLRYYERRGLLARPDRTPGGHRLYPAESVTLLRVVKAAQRLGFTLDEVAELLEAGRPRHLRSGPGPGPGRPADTGSRGAALQARAEAKLAEVRARIADLQVIADTLQAAVTAGCDDLLACAEQSCCPIPFTPLAGPPPGPAPGAAAGTAAGTPAGTAPACGCGA